MENKRIEVTWLDNTNLEIAAMNAIAEVMRFASYSNAGIDKAEEQRIARWFYSKYCDDK